MEKGALVEEFRKKDSTKNAAEFFMSLSKEDQLQFVSFSAKRQAALLHIPNRRYNRFLRECNNDVDYIVQHCNTILGKKKTTSARVARMRKEYAQSEGYLSYADMQRAQERQKEQSKSTKALTDQQQHYAILARQAEQEEKNNII